MANSGTAKMENAKDDTGKHSHTMMVYGFKGFNIRAKEHYFFLQAV